MNPAAEASPARTFWSSLGIRLGRNTLWLLLARVGTQASMVVFTILLARRLGEVGLGQYAFMVSAIFLANVVTTFGTDMLLIREIAAQRDFSQVPAALLLQLSLSLPFILLTFLFAPALPNQTAGAVRALQIYSLALLPMAFYTVFSAVLRGLERMGSFALLNLATSFAQVLAIWLLVRPGTGIVPLAWLLLLIQALSALLAGGLCLSQIPGLRRAWSASRPALITLLRVSAPIALLGILKVLYLRLGVYMLALMQGAATTGLYSAALRTVEAAQIGHVVFIGALFPVLAQAHDPQRDQNPSLRETVSSLSWHVFLTLGLAAGLLVYFLALPLVGILFGAGFEPAVPALRLLAWLLLPYSVNIYLSSQLLAARREREIAISLGVSLVLLGALNAFLIPPLGLIGACLAAVGAEAVQALMFLAFWFRKHARPTAHADS